MRIIDDDSEDNAPYFKYHVIYTSFLAAACVNFSQPVYEVLESSMFVEICVDLEGSLEDLVIVNLLTIPGSATGKLL